LGLGVRYDRFVYLMGAEDAKLILCMKDEWSHSFMQVCGK